MTRSIVITKIPSNEHKISAIKDLRNIVGMGLKEAKDIVDEVVSFGKSTFSNYLNPYEHCVKQLKIAGFTVNSSNIMYNANYDQVKEALSTLNTIAIENDMYDVVRILMDAAERFKYELRIEQPGDINVDSFLLKDR